jgi:hypothetical protein
MKIQVLCFVLLLTGCTTVWVRPGATQQDFAQDKYQCMNESERNVVIGASGSQGFVGAAVGGMAFGAAMAQKARFDSCMEAHGWVVRK